MNEQKSYKQIVKTTSLLGCVQVVKIIIGIIQLKFVAVLLGTTGMGILGLYTTTLSLIQIVTGFGLSSSAVRDIAEANGSCDSLRIAKIITMFRRWVWVTGLSGTIITISLAPMLSKWTFGSQKYTLSFVLLSVICLLSGISSGQNVLLQGMRRLRQMAKSMVLGSVFGLFTSVPLYYLYGLKGIVLSLIIVAVSSLLFSWYFTRQIPVQIVKQTWSDTYHSGLNMAKLGFVMMLSGFIATLVSYIVTIFISNKGGTSEVGIYRAGWIIATQYTGLVFTSMGTDFYPRLAAINKDNKKMNELVNEQAEMGIIILTPLLVFLIGFVPLVIQIFYTKEFIPIAVMIKWCMGGMLWKAASWAFAFSIIAKGDKKIFFITETTGNIVILFCNLIGYWLWGIEGIGIAFFIGYFVYCLLVVCFTKKRYAIFCSLSFMVLFIKSFSLVMVTFVVAYFVKNIMFTYAATTLLFGVSVLSFLYEIDKKIGIIKYLPKRFNSLNNLGY